VNKENKIMPLPFLRIYFLAAPAVLFFLVTVPKAPGQARVQAVLQPRDQRSAAPELRLEDSSGKPVSLKDYHGKVVLLDFWATWCHGCQEEIPWFSEFQRKYGRKGFRVIGVSLDEDGWKVVKPFIKSAKIPYRIALGYDETAKQYSIESMPDTFLIDRDGKIAAKYVGLVDKNNVDSNIRTMLAVR
jgi:cytochrome c biogenesis protein CcmG/thiol:disulfide interchange protein DsbE